MTETEGRNLKAVNRWMETYNDDVEALVTEVYAENCRVSSVLGGATIEGRERFRKLELRVLKMAPRRKIRLDRTHAAGDIVVVEATLLDPDRGDDWKSPFCAILTFKDGKVAEDRTYMDETRWPGFQRPN